MCKSLLAIAWNIIEFLLEQSLKSSCQQLDNSSIHSACNPMKQTCLENHKTHWLQVVFGSLIGLVVVNDNLQAPPSLQYKNASMTLWLYSLWSCNFRWLYLHKTRNIICKAPQWFSSREINPLNQLHWLSIQTLSQAQILSMICKNKEQHIRYVQQNKLGAYEK